MSLHFESPKVQSNRYLVPNSRLLSFVILSLYKLFRKQFCNLNHQSMKNLFTCMLLIIAAEAAAQPTSYPASAGDGGTSNSTYIGFGAGNSNTAAENTFIGYYSGFNNTGGLSNTYVGMQSGQGNFTGDYNVALGVRSGQ